MSSNTPLDVTYSPDLPGWLRAENISFAFTTYQTNRLFCGGTNTEGRLALQERLFDKPMGLFAHDDRLYMSTRYQVWQMDNLLAPGEIWNQADRLYFPKQAHTTGDLNVHDVVIDDAGALLFVNTDFSCLARLSADYSFEPIWQPPFISRLVAEDRCHLNGLAMRNGQPAYMTACSLTDQAAGWREHRKNGGAVLDIASNRIIATGLSMPHSPRWYRDKLWLLNSGTGELGYVDFEQAAFVPLTFCPGFVRGLAFWKNFALVGLSKLRSKPFTGLILEDRLKAIGGSPQCGLMIIDLEMGEVAHWLRLEGVVEELFDVVVLPEVRQPQSIGFQSDEIERLVTFPDHEGIVVTKPTVKRPSQGGMAPIGGVPRELWASAQPEASSLLQSSPVTAADLETLKFQQVYHLSPDNLTDYEPFTFPSLQQRWQQMPQRGELYGVSATIYGDMVAFAIAEIYSDSTAEILSLFVAPPYRRQGIGQRLVAYLERGIRQEGGLSVAIAYTPTSLTDLALEPLLHRLGWPPIQRHQTLCRAIKRFGNVKPIETAPAKLKFAQGKQFARDENYDAAVACFKEAIALNPNFIAAYNQLGNAYQALGQTDAAIATYQKLLALNPTIAEAHCNLGSCFQLQDQIEDAIASYQCAIKLKPDFALPYLNLGRLFGVEGRLDEAKIALKTALKLHPQDAEIYFELGMLLRQRGDIKRAIGCLEKAVECNPDQVDVLHDLGCLRMIPGHLDEAEVCFRRVIELDPDHVKVYGNLGQILTKKKEFAEALTCYDRAVALNPEDVNLDYQREYLRISLCDWDNYDERINKLQQRIEAYLVEDDTAPLLPLYVNSFPMPLTVHRQIAEKIARHMKTSAQPFEAHCQFVPPPPSSERIKLAYLSADFRRHAVGTLIHQLFQYHDRSKFEVYGYSLVDTVDEFTASIQAGCDQFVNLAHLTPDASARRIHEDGIHMLIDMAGYTSFSRPEILALKPAPIQIQYLGHPDTMGAEFIPYILADRWLIPTELEDQYQEQVLEIPHAFVGSPSPASETTCSRAEFGLPMEAFVFCCFNRSDKYDPTIFETWMRILQRVPGSVLWLIEASDEVSQSLWQRAEAVGVAANRIIFTPSMPLETYMAAYTCADLFLDTWVYNAGATGVHALQAGVPILTCPGESFVARMGASICAAAGLEGLICDSLRAYEERAVSLATHPSELAMIQDRLKNEQEVTPLFQLHQWVKQLEARLLQLYADIDEPQIARSPDLILCD